VPPRTSTELGHLSVLSIDLVGFTPFSKMDQEEVREGVGG
jgi:hypothetical protein